MFTNSGTLTCAPVSSVAGFVPPPEAVSPRRPGSVSVTSRSTALGICRSAGWPSIDSSSTSSFGRVHLSGLGERRLRDRDLLERLGVHEVRVGAVGVEELHLAHLGPHRAELLAGAERAVDHVPVARPPQLRPHERPALAGLDVLELEDLEDRPLDVDVVAVLELVRRNQINQSLLQAKSAVLLKSRSGSVLRAPTVARTGSSRTCCGFCRYSGGEPYCCSTATTCDHLGSPTDSAAMQTMSM